MASRPHPHDPDFTYLRQGDQVLAKCNYCAELMQPERIEEHRISCRNNPNNIEADTLQE